MEGCPTHYILLLLIFLVPQVHLHVTLSYNGAEDNPRMLCNLHHHLEGYQWLHYMFLPLIAKEDIASGINTSLGICESCAHLAA